MRSLRGWPTRLLIVGGCGFALIAAAALRARADLDNGAREFFASPQSAVIPGAPLAITPRSYVAKLLDAEMAKQGLPMELRPTGQRIAQIESQHRCSAIGPLTRHGRALGPLQIMPSSARALGYRGPDAALNSCGEGLVWGVRHMKNCVAEGYATARDLAWCHVAGARNRGLRSAYAASYVQMVTAAKLRAPVQSGAFRQRFAMVEQREAAR